MITYEQALNLILANTQVLSTEKIPITEAVGRILDEDIYSHIEMPPFDKSAMDGYAVYYSDIQKIPVKLKCIGNIQAGESFNKRVNKGECVKIMTGAPLPQGTDTVIMVEDTRQTEDYVEILEPTKKGKNVCIQGEDIKKGEKILERGREIFSSDIPLLATIGKGFVKVIKKPKVAIINTGNEIVPIGKRLGKNKIYNSNGPTLNTLLNLDKIEVEYLGIIQDDVDKLKEAVAKGLKSDMLLISGGVSVGDYDFIPTVLKELDVKQIFHKVNIKPGKPLFCGIRNKTLIFGIPGNPVSNFLSYLIFIQPALYKMIGNKDFNFEEKIKQGIIDTDFLKKSDRRHFVLIKISKGKITPIHSHGSADVLSLSKADGFMIVDENCEIKKGTTVRFITWK